MNKKEEIFTISDKTNNGTISKFEVDSNGIRVFFEEKPENYHVSLNSINHVKQPLFTTEDGVDFFKGDEYFTVYTMNNTRYQTCSTQSITFKADGKSTDYLHKNVKYFSTKEKAEQYITMNKPCLSLQDIYNISSIYYLNQNMTKPSTSLFKYKKNDLKQLVKQKLNK